MLSVLDLPSEMDHTKSGRGRFRPVIQYIMDWNGLPARRTEMLAGGEPPTGNTPSDLALIAAVIHGLCARDGVPVPDWVASHRLSPPATMTGRPLDSDWGRWVVSQAPQVCFDHGVFFEADMLSAR